MIFSNNLSRRKALALVASFGSAFSVCNAEDEKNEDSLLHEELKAKVNDRIDEIFRNGRVIKSIAQDGSENYSMYISWHRLSRHGYKCDALVGFPGDHGLDVFMNLKENLKIWKNEKYNIPKFRNFTLFNVWLSDIKEFGINDLLWINGILNATVSQKNNRLSLASECVDGLSFRRHIKLIENGIEFMSAPLLFSEKREFKLQATLDPLGLLRFNSA